MAELTQLFFTALPWLLALLVPVVIVTWLAVGSGATWLWVAVYFICIFYFPNVSWGLVDNNPGSNFYTRATGTFYFSAINLLLFGLVAQAFLARRFANIMSVPHNLRIPALLFGLLLIGNAVVGTLLPDIRWFNIVGASGLLNVANMMFAFYVLTTSLRSERDFDRFIDVLLFCAVTRGLWGVARFLAMGGDPANFYSNFQYIDVKITFFDINDSLIAALALFIAAWRLATGQCASSASKTLHWAIVGLELFIIVFSYRRAVWGGLALAAVLFAVCQRATLRNALWVAYACIGVPAIGYKLLRRGGSGSGTEGVSFLEKVLPDVFQYGQFSFTTGRFAELYAALISIKESPLWGLGLWGRYDGFRFPELAWHRGEFTWMHSGVLHILLKTGLLGVSIMVVVLLAYFSYVARHRHQLAPKYAGLMMAGAAGILFMLPNWLFGTPVIEFRTMQMIALCLAIPYLAAACALRVATIGPPRPARPRSSA